jgi:CRP-like cAMP-binding protein
LATVRDEQRIDALLADDASSERIYAKDEIIVRQGDVGNSIFIIGSGTAETMLGRTGDSGNRDPRGERQEPTSATAGPRRARLRAIRSCGTYRIPG